MSWGHDEPLKRYIQVREIGNFLLNNTEKVAKLAGEISNCVDMEANLHFLALHFSIVDFDALHGAYFLTMLNFLQILSLPS